MLRSTWKELEYVSSESPYISELVNVINAVVNIVKKNLEQKKYVRSFCDKAVGCAILDLLASWTLLLALLMTNCFPGV